MCIIAGKMTVISNFFENVCLWGPSETTGPIWIAVDGCDDTPARSSIVTKTERFTEPGGKIMETCLVRSSCASSDVSVSVVKSLSMMGYGACVSADVVPCSLRSVEANGCGMSLSGSGSMSERAADEIACWSRCRRFSLNNRRNRSES